MRCLTIPILCLAAATAAAVDDPWETLDGLDARGRELRQELRVLDEALAALREGMPDPAAAELAAVRKALADAEAAEAAAHTAAGLDEMRDRLRAAQAARDELCTGILARSPRFAATAARQAAVQARLGELTGHLAGLSVDEARELGALRLEERTLDHQLYQARRARWQHPDVKAAFERAGRLYQTYGKKSGADAGLKQARNAVKQARRSLDAVLAGLAPGGETAATLLERRAGLVGEEETVSARAESLRQDLLGGATQVTLAVERPPRKGQPGKPAEITLWMAPRCERVRGVVVAAPQFGKFASDHRIREAAARTGLATMVFHGIGFDGEESWRNLDAVLAKLAEKSGHPELAGAAVLTAGLSASVIQARNLAYVRPERVLGVVQVAGGNLHHQVPAGKTLDGVPFIAMNGELEWCGPEGGIRPEYGRQTQWVMIREQLLRRWRGEHRARMSLVVVPGGDHCAWSPELAALFVRKAARYRLPASLPADGPVTCREIPAAEGWLTDADLDNPTHPPAAYGDYAGDRDHAFWHFDREMAEAVRAYHDDRFVLPDPTKASPVPADWPPGRN